MLICVNTGSLNRRYHYFVFTFISYMSVRNYHLSLRNTPEERSSHVHIGFWWENLREIEILHDLIVDGRTILKCL